VPALAASIAAPAAMAVNLFMSLLPIPLDAVPADDLGEPNNRTTRKSIAPAAAAALSARWRARSLRAVFGIGARTWN
jgi:hypothetical protein